MVTTTSTRSPLHHGGGGGGGGVCAATGGLFPPGLMAGEGEDQDLFYDFIEQLMASHGEQMDKVQDGHMIEKTALEEELAAAEATVKHTLEENRELRRALAEQQSGRETALAELLCVKARVMELEQEVRELQGQGHKESRGEEQGQVAIDRTSTAHEEQLVVGDDAMMMQAAKVSSSGIMARVVWVLCMVALVVVGMVALPIRSSCPTYRPFPSQELKVLNDMLKDTDWRNRGRPVV